MQQCVLDYVFPVWPVKLYCCYNETVNDIKVRRWNQFNYQGEMHAAMGHCIGHNLIVLPLHHSVAVLMLMENDVQYSGHHEIFHKLIYSQKYLFVGSSSLPSICLPPYTVFHFRINIQFCVFHVVFCGLCLDDYLF